MKQNTPADMTTEELATVARDGFISAWNELERRGIYTDKCKWDFHPDGLAHINHVAENDERGQEMDTDLLQNLRDRCAEMNQMASASIAPIEEFEELITRSDNNESVDVDGISEGDVVEVTVEAIDGELKDDEEFSVEVEYVGEQNLSAQSRKVSHEFKRVSDGRTCYVRFPGRHENNLGFVMSQRDTSEMEFAAMWKDPIEDDREWNVKCITAV